MWELIHKDKGGHKLFLDQSDKSYRDPWPRVYVADNSGFSPDQTEDGIIEVSQDIGKIVFTPSADGKDLVCYVKAIVRGKPGYGVGLSKGCAVKLAEVWGLRMFLDLPYLNRAIQLEAADIV